MRFCISLESCWSGTPFRVEGCEQKPLAEGASVIAIVSQMLGLELLPSPAGTAMSLDP